MVHGVQSVGVRVGDAACASKYTHKKQFRYQCTAMSSLSSIIISMLHIIKLRQHCRKGEEEESMRWEQRESRAR